MPADPPPAAGTNIVGTGPRMATDQSARVGTVKADSAVVELIAAAILHGPGEWCGGGKELAALAAAVEQQVQPVLAARILREDAALRAALRYLDTCTEEVARRGELQPCGKAAVGLRYDPTEGTPYPVCPFHCRGRMAPLSQIAATLTAPPR